MRDREREKETYYALVTRRQRYFNLAAGGSPGAHHGLASSSDVHFYV